MQRGKIAKIAFSVVCLATAGVVLAKYYWAEPTPRGSRAFTHWICTNAECKNEFTVPWKDFQKAMKKDGGLKCPKCGAAEPERGAKCPSCGRVLHLGAHFTVPPKCSYCNKPVPARPRDPPPDDE